MTGGVKRPAPRTGVAGKVLLTVSPFVLLAALFLIHRWLS